MAAYVLTKAGAKCLMVEAGDYFDTAKDSKMFIWPYEAPHRGAATPEKPMGSSIRDLAAGIFPESLTLMRRVASGAGGALVACRFELISMKGVVGHRCIST
jgi:hypothetical protein